MSVLKYIMLIQHIISLLNYVVDILSMSKFTYIIYMVYNIIHEIIIIINSKYFL